MHFRPMIWLTLLAVPALVVLVMLGNWQMDRLAWKEALLERIERGMNAAPQPLPDAALWEGVDTESLAYSPVVVRGTFRHREEMHVYLPSLEGQAGYHVVTPFNLANGGTLLIDRGFVPREAKDPATRPEGQVEGEVTVTGILVEPEGANAFTPEPDLAANTWYHRDLGAMAETAGLSRVFPLMLDAGPEPNPGGLPVGGQTRLELRNPHLGYAMTWYGLAVTLVGVWLAMHIATGRLRLNR